MKISKLDNQIYILIGIIVLGLFFRLYSLNYGLPYVFGPDEKRQVLDALSMAARHSLVPMEYTYPALHKYILLFCFGIYYFVGIMLKSFSGVSDFVLKLLIDPGKIFLLARLISVIFGTALVWPVYLLCKRFFSPNVGLISSLFCVSMYSLIAHSQWAMGDIVLVFWSVWAFYYILRCESGAGVGDFIVTGVLIGLATITKYQGAFLIIPFLTGLFLSRKELVRNKQTILKISLAVIFYLSILVLGNLGIIFNLKANLQRLMELKDEIMGISSLKPFSNNIVSVTAWFIKELLRQELLLGGVLVLGIVYALFKRTKSDLIFLSYLLVCLFSLVNFGFRFLHLLVCSFAVICIFGARFLEDFTRILLKEKNRVGYSLILAAVVVVPSLNTAFRLDMRRSQQDTRIIAGNWVRQNITLGSTIAEDWFDFSPPLQSTTPILFQDEKLKDYYVKYFSPGIREAYTDYALNKGSYNLVQVRFETEEPVWPKDASRDFLKSANSIALVKRLYRWFNFHSLEELRAAKVDYLIISSYSYNHFLLDEDKNKKSGLFTISNTEDTLTSNRQSKYYMPNTKYGLMFYLTKRARDFYLPLLSIEKTDRGVTLVKEIFPASNNLGPVLRIYKIDIAKMVPNKL